MAASQLSSKPVLALLQLLLLAAVAAMQLRSSSSSSSEAAASSSRSAAAAAVNQVSKGNLTPKSPFSDAGGPAPAAAAAADDDGAHNNNSSSSSVAGGEDVTCCGWSLRLVAGDVVSVPGRHLQLQIAMARADRGLTALRQRMASMNLSIGRCVENVLGAGIGALRRYRVLLFLKFAGWFSCLAGRRLVTSLGT
jgi:hypothetical protein